MQKRVDNFINVSLWYTTTCTSILVNSRRHGLYSRQIKPLPVFLFKHRLAIRRHFNPIHWAGKLVQQYLVDAWVKIESTRLQYHRQNQAQLRVEQYQGLMDHLQQRAAQENTAVGRMVILPSTFQARTALMHQRP